MEKVMHNSPETTTILRRMEEVRCDLDEDVQEIIEDARGLGKWRTYVRSYPWVCLGAAVAAGFLIVPRRRIGMEPHIQSSTGLPSQSCLLATSHLPPSGSLRGMLLAFVGNLVMRQVASYVEQQVGNLSPTQAAASAPEPNHEHPHSGTPADADPHGQATANGS